MNQISNYEEFQDGSVVGVSFFGRSLILKGFCLDCDYMQSGWKIKKVNCILKLEEDNEFDMHAIGVWIEGYLIGHIPEGANRRMWDKVKKDSDRFGVRIGGAIFIHRDESYIPTVKLNALVWESLLCP